MRSARLFQSDDVAAPLGQALLDVLEDADGRFPVVDGEHGHPEKVRLLGVGYAGDAGRAGVGGGREHAAAGGGGIDSEQLRDSERDGNVFLELLVVELVDKCARGF